MNGWNQFTDEMSSYDIIAALKIVSPEIAYFIKTRVQPTLTNQKVVQAIKILRDKSGMSLLLAKRVVDELREGATINIVRFCDPMMLDDIEHAEQSIKRAIRRASDDKVAAGLLGIRDQLADLWTDLAELPVPPYKE